MFCPIINIGSGEDITIHELAKSIAEVVGYKGEFVQDRSKPDGTMRKVMDIGKLSQLGWSPSINLRAGLELTYKAFLEKK